MHSIISSPELLSALLRESKKPFLEIVGCEEGDLEKKFGVDSRDTPKKLGPLATSNVRIANRRKKTPTIGKE